MEVSKSIPEFVEKWVCLHTPVSKTMKATMERDLQQFLWKAMEESIDMYVEERDKRGQDHITARAKACMEVSEGLSFRE